MDTVQTALFQAMRADFLAEAWAVAGQVYGRFVLLQDLPMKRPIMECSEVPIR
jgi:hypothetical protein